MTFPASTIPSTKASVSSGFARQIEQHIEGDRPRAFPRENPHELPVKISRPRATVDSTFRIHLESSSMATTQTSGGWGSFAPKLEEGIEALLFPGRR